MLTVMIGVILCFGAIVLGCFASLILHLTAPPRCEWCESSTDVLPGFNKSLLCCDCRAKANRVTTGPVWQ